MKKRILSVVLIFCLCLTAAVFGSGCNDGETPPENNSPLAQEENKYGGTLRMTMGNFNTSLFAPKITQQGMWRITDPVLEPLGRANAEGGVDPLLAESFESDADAKTFNIKLREGIKFHDGSDLNAEVLEWIIGEYEKVGNVSDTCGPSSWEAVDEYTVVMHFEEYSNTWLDCISRIRLCSKQAYEEKGADWCETFIVGTGPFVMQEFVPLDHFIYVKNENYWQEGLPYLDSIEGYNISDVNSATVAMINGEIDFYSITDSGAADMLKAEGDRFKVVSEKSAAANSVMYMAMPSAVEGSPFADVNVRRALYMAIDRPAIGETLTSGFGYGVNQFLTERMVGYLTDDELYDTYDYDPEEAKLLLEQAGYPNGFEVDLYTIQNREPTAIAIKSYAEAIGININIQIKDGSTFFQLGDEKTDGLFINGSTCYSLANTIPSLERLYGKNAYRFVAITESMPELDALVDAAKVTRTQEELEEAAKAVQYYANEYLPMACLYIAGQDIYAVKELYDANLNTISGIVWTPDTAYLLND